MKLSDFFPQHFFRRAQHHFQLLFHTICVSVVVTSLGPNNVSPRYRLNCSDSHIQTISETKM